MERAETSPTREPLPRRRAQVTDVPVTSARRPSTRLADDSVPECPAEELNEEGPKGSPLRDMVLRSTGG